MDASEGAHRGMSRQMIELILDMWENPRPGDYQHPYWKFAIPQPVPEIGLQFHVTPYQKPHPPIGVAGVSPKSDTLLLAGEKGWLPLSINLVPPATLKSHWEAVEAGAASDGAHSGPVGLAHRPRDLRCRDHRAGPGRGAERHHWPRLSPVFHTPDEATWTR